MPGTPLDKPPNGVLLVANYPPDVGYAWWLMESFWVAIAEFGRTRKNHSVLIYPAPGPIPEAIRTAPITVVHHDFSDRGPGSLRRLHRLIKKHRIRFVYLTDQPYLDLRYLLLRLWGVRHIVMHDHVPGERERPGPIRRALKRSLHALRIVSASRYIGVSRFVRERLVAVACIPSALCSYVHNGIVLSDSRPPDKDFLTAEFAIPRNATVVVSTGRATHYKGIGFMIEVAERIVRHPLGANVYFLHCGAGPDLEYFVEQARASGLGERFILAGHRNDIPRILPGCDIALHAATGEAFSLSILEYMAAGLTVLAPDNCGNGEAIEDRNSGFLYPPGNHDEVVDLLLHLLADSGHRQTVGRHAQQRVAEHFTLDTCVENFMNEIAALMP